MIAANEVLLSFRIVFDNKRSKANILRRIEHIISPLLQVQMKGEDKNTDHSNNFNKECNIKSWANPRPGHTCTRGGVKCLGVVSIPAERSHMLYALSLDQVNSI